MTQVTREGSTVYYYPQNQVANGNANVSKVMDELRNVLAAFEALVMTTGYSEKQIVTSSGKNIHVALVDRDTDAVTMLPQLSMCNMCFQKYIPHHFYRLMIYEPCLYVDKYDAYEGVKAKAVDIDSYSVHRFFHHPIVAPLNVIPPDKIVALSNLLLD